MFSGFVKIRFEAFVNISRFDRVTSKFDRVSDLPRWGGFAAVPRTVVDRLLAEGEEEPVTARPERLADVRHVVGLECGVLSEARREVAEQIWPAV